MPLSSGSRLGPYQIEDLLGAGGMGEVYKARDTRLDRTVAIKVLPSGFSNDPALRQRLEREARAGSALDHPNICALYDIGAENGIDFIVMQYLPGETLAARLARGPLPVEEACRFGAQIADALSAAHRRGIVHRDLKPGPRSGGDFRSQISSDGGGQPRWRGDGRELYYVSLTGAVMAVPLTVEKDHLTPGKPVALFTEPSLRTNNNLFFCGGAAGYDVTPNGQRPRQPDGS